MGFGRIVKDNETLKIIRGISQEACEVLGGTYVNENGEAECIIREERKGENIVHKRPSEIKVIRVSDAEGGTQ